MKGVYRGAPAKGCPAPGSWGDRYVIEKEAYHSDKMSCNKCIHYCSDDKSCSVKPVYLPVDGWDYWKRCDKLQLSPEYNTDELREKIRRVKGENYLSSKKINTVKTTSNISAIPKKSKDSNKNKSSKQEIKKEITVDEIPIAKGVLWKDFVEHVILSLNNKYKTILVKSNVTSSAQDLFSIYTDERRKVFVSIRNLTYTKSGERISYKISMGLISQEVFFMEKLPKSGVKIIVVPKILYKPNDSKTLGQVYYEKYKNVLGGINIIEASMTGKLYSYNSVNKVSDLTIN